MPALAGVWCGVGVRPRLLAPLSHGTGRGSPRSFSSFSTRKRLRCFHSSSPAICAAGRSGGTGETLLPGERGERQHRSFHENKAAPAFPSHPNSTQGGQLQLAPPAAISVPLPALLFLFNAVKSRLVPTGHGEGSGKVALLPCNRACQNPQKYWKIKACLLGCCTIY